MRYPNTTVAGVCAAAAFAVLALSCPSGLAPGGPAGPSASSRHSAASGGDWSNEPSGLVTLTDRTWTGLVGEGWNRRPSSDDRIVADPSAPAAPAPVLEYVFPSGFHGGVAPATHYFPLAGKREIFVGLELKISNPWQGHSSYVNKIQFLYTASSDVAMVFYGPPGGSFELRVLPQWSEHRGAWLTPNIGRTAPTLGAWHRLEWYMRYESSYGAGDGIVRWWLDGQLAGEYPNVRYPRDGGFTEYQISPTWGGVGDVKTESDYYRFARSYIASR